MLALLSLVVACAETGPFPHHAYVEFPPDLLRPVDEVAARESAGDAANRPDAALPSASLPAAGEGRPSPPPTRADDPIVAPDGTPSPSRPERRIQPPDTAPFRLDALTDFVPDFELERDLSPSITPYERLAVRDAVIADASGWSLIARPTAYAPWPAIVAPDGGAADCMRHVGRFRRDVESGTRLVLPSAAPQMDVRVDAVRGPVPVAERMTGDLLVIRFDEPGEAVFDLHIAWSPEYAANPPYDLPGATSTPLQRARTLGRHLACRATLAPAPPPEPAPIPAGLRDEAQTVLALIGLRGDEPAEVIYARLAHHYGRFRAEPLTESEQTGNLYVDLARAQKGVCRHRAHGFVLTALALGLPARLVFNQVHAFVEVHDPAAGWVRIDLGGGAADISRPDDAPTDEAPSDTAPRDSTPRPTTNPSASLPPDIAPLDNLPPQSAPPDATRPDPAPPSPPGNDPGATSSTPRESAGSDDGAPLADGAPREVEPGRTADASDVAATRDPEPPGSETLPPRATNLVVDAWPRRAAAGGRVVSNGRVLDPDGDAVPGIEVEWRVRTGTRRIEEIGRARTDDAGGFTIEGMLPADLPVASDVELEWLVMPQGRWLGSIWR